jgi:predicted transposase/invertase (TIGR01784 family)
MGKKRTGNKEYKDNVFRLLFGDETKSAELYNAIKGTNYKADTVKMNTLQNPLFFGDLRNDVSFTVEDKLIILLEHQSSINPNMGLRFLLYIAAIYEILIDRKAMYKPAPMSIANPEFYVLYNGKENYPEKAIIKLSDLFEIKGVENNLELTVTVFNANTGYNKNIMERSRTLDEYAAFVAKVREYTENSKLDLTESLKKAVEDCVKNNILKEFLQKHGGEIVNILFREWNLDDALEAREEYRAEQIAEDLLRDGMSKETVAKYTKLTIVQVEKIIKRINKKNS